MTTGRINQVAFLRDVGHRTSPSSPTVRLAGARDGARASFASRDEMRTPGGGGRDPTPTKRSASESTVERPCANAAAPVGGHARCTGRDVVRPAAPEGARRKGDGDTTDCHRYGYAAQDPEGPPGARWPRGERLKRSAGRQFDASSTEPANTHNQSTTHMPIAYEWQRPRAPDHDPPR